MGMKGLRQEPTEALNAQVIRGSLIKHAAVFGPQSSEEKVQSLYQMIVRQITRSPSFLACKNLEVSKNILMI
jgi:hypothetical protein